MKPVRIYNLINFFDLSKSKVNHIEIKDFLEVVKKRTLIREKDEKELFLILIKGMKKQGMTVDNFDKKFDMSAYDSDSNLQLNINEFKGILSDLKIEKQLNDN